MAWFLKQRLIYLKKIVVVKYNAQWCTVVFAMMFEKRKQGNNRVSINGRFMANDSAEK